MRDLACVSSSKRAGMKESSFTLKQRKKKSYIPRRNKREEKVSKKEEGKNGATTLSDLEGPTRSMITPANIAIRLIEST